MFTNRDLCLFRSADTRSHAEIESQLSRQRWDALTEEEQDKFPHFCPDFVVELMFSGNSLLKKQGLKIENILKMGQN